MADLEPGQRAHAVFALRRGVPAAVSDLSAIVVRNGTDNAVPATVAETTPGRYLVEFDVPAAGWSPGDLIHARIGGRHDGQPMRPQLLRVGVVADPPAALDAQAVASAVWDAASEDYRLPGTMGGFVQRKLLTFCKAVGLFG